VINKKSDMDEKLENKVQVDIDEDGEQDMFVKKYDKVDSLNFDLYSKNKKNFNKIVVEDSSSVKMTFSKHTHSNNLDINAHSSYENIGGIEKITSDLKVSVDILKNTNFEKNEVVNHF
jgi:hypothetical protein